MKDDAVYIVHIIDCIDRINENTENDQFVFMNSQIVQDAVIRNLQTLAESTQKVFDELKAQHPKINWKAISKLKGAIRYRYCTLYKTNKPH